MFSVVSKDKRSIFEILAELGTGCYIFTVIMTLYEIWVIFCSVMQVTYILININTKQFAPICYREKPKFYFTSAFFICP